MIKSAINGTKLENMEKRRPFEMMEREEKSPSFIVDAIRQIGDGTLRLEKLHHWSFGKR